MKTFKIDYEALPPASETPRGLQTFEWLWDSGMQITIYRREEGEVFGGHFHTGSDPNRNPERILLVSGVVHWWQENLDSTIVRSTIDASDAPQEICIRPYVLHGGVAKTNCIYIELRDRPFNKTGTPSEQDVLGLEEWNAFKKERSK